MKFKLYDYQREDVERLKVLLRNNRRAGNFLEMGLGKSAEAITICKELKLNPKRILITIPASLRVNWEREWRKWWPGSELPEIRTYNFLQYGEKAVTLAETKWDIVIADECQAMKNWASKTTKNFYKYCYPRTTYYLAMSGTPATRSAEDYHALLSMLEPGVWGKLGSFRKKYCYKRTVFLREFWYGFKNHDILKQALKRVGVRRLKKDVQKDLPAVSYNNLWVEIKKAKLCRELGCTLEALDWKPGVDKEGELKEPPPHISSLLRVLGTFKAEACAEWLQSRLEPTIVFYTHTDVCDELRKIYIGVRKVGAISGKTPMKKRQIILDSFQAGDIDVLLLQIQAGGVGLNAQRASEIIFIEQPWSSAIYEQAVSRAHRIGQENKISVYTVVAVDTVDEAVSNVLEMKRTNLRRIEDE